MSLPPLFCHPNKVVELFHVPPSGVTTNGRTEIHIDVVCGIRDPTRAGGSKGYGFPAGSRRLRAVRAFWELARLQ